MPEDEPKSIELDLPFDPTANPVVISQGFNSPFSHKPSPAFDLTYSVDFALPVGTPVTAVQDGIVRRVMKYTDCYRGYDAKIGRNNWATSLEINSPDNPRVFSMLQHLDPDSILVEAGQQITRGQALAKTGLTGWVGPIPHLHLSMVNATKRPLRTLPFHFRGYDESLEDDAVNNRLYDYPYYSSDTRMFTQIIAARDKAHELMR